MPMFVMLLLFIGSITGVLLYLLCRVVPSLSYSSETAISFSMLVGTFVLLGLFNLFTLAYFVSEFFLKKEYHFQLL